MAWEISSPPIVTAASYGLVRTVAALLDVGTLPSARNSDGETALHAAIEQPEVLAFTRYSFSSRPLYTNQYYHLQTAPLFGHTTTTLHCPHYCAIQCFPPTILYCNTCHTTLVIAISCKGQPRCGRIHTLPPTDSMARRHTPGIYTLHVEYAEGSIIYGILFLLSLLYAYSNLE